VRKLLIFGQGQSFGEAQAKLPVARCGKPHNSFAMPELPRTRSGACSNGELYSPIAQHAFNTTNSSPAHYSVLVIIA